MIIILDRFTKEISAFKNLKVCCDFYKWNYNDLKKLKLSNIPLRINPSTFISRVKMIKSIDQGS